MTTNGEFPATSAPAAAPREGRPRLSGVRGLMVAVACFGAIFWSGRRLATHHDPAVVTARLLQRDALDSLRSADPARRLTGIRTLYGLEFVDDAVSIAPMVAATDDAVAENRLMAVQVLGALAHHLMWLKRDDEVVKTAPALIARLTDADEAVRIAAIRSLSPIVQSLARLNNGAETPDEATTALVGRLEDPAASVRSAAIRWIAESAPGSDPEEVERRLAGMLRDPEVSVRLAAIKAMAPQPWRSDPPKALAEALEDESSEIRKAAVASLTSYRQGLDPWIPILFRLVEHDPDSEVRHQCFWGLVGPFETRSVTRAAVPSLIEGLGSKDASIRSLAAALLGGCGEAALEALPDLLSALNDPLPSGDYRHRDSRGGDPACKAAETLSRITPGTAHADRVVTALIEFARSGSRERRSAAALALSGFGSDAEKAVPALAEILGRATEEQGFDGETTTVRALVGIAPGTPSAGRAVSALLPGLRSRSPYTRRLTVEALVPFTPDSTEAVAGVRSLKNDPDAQVRQAVENALLASEGAAVPKPRPTARKRR